MEETEALIPKQQHASLAARLRELSMIFLRLGAISFGGPAAHIALIEAEIVRKRQWTDRQQFLDMVGAANLIPGPTSTELAINIGYARAGWLGLAVAGTSFIVPAALITGAFAWAYVQFGSLPKAELVLGGIKPAVIAVIALAIWRLGKTAMKNVALAVLAAVALAAFLLGLNPIAILFGGGVLGMFARQLRRPNPAGALLIPPTTPLRIYASHLKNGIGRILTAPLGAVFALSTTTVPAGIPKLWRIGLFFLKVGAVLYGGGYVLLAFLDRGLVQQNAWLTQKQLLDAVAIGQFTPGPVLSTATFIGFILHGASGAAVATVAIFLPSFLYVALLAPLLFRLRKSPWMSAFLDSVNACAVALMAGVTLQLAKDALRGWPAWVILGIALAVLLRWKMNPAWIVLGGGLAGLGLAAVR